MCIALLVLSDHYRFNVAVIFSYIFFINYMKFLRFLLFYFLLYKIELLRNIFNFFFITSRFIFSNLKTCSGVWQPLRNSLDLLQVKNSCPFISFKYAVSMLRSLKDMTRSKLRTDKLDRQCVFFLEEWKKFWKLFKAVSFRLARGFNEYLTVCLDTQVQLENILRMFDIKKKKLRLNHA